MLTYTPSCNVPKTELKYCEIPAYYVVEQFNTCVDELTGDELLHLFLTGEYPENVTMTKKYHAVDVSF